LIIEPGSPQLSTFFPLNIERQTSNVEHQTSANTAAQNPRTKETVQNLAAGLYTRK
jgi:hypothetical protein